MSEPTRKFSIVKLLGISLAALVYGGDLEPFLGRGIGLVLLGSGRRNRGGQHADQQRCGTNYPEDPGLILQECSPFAFAKCVGGKLPPPLPGTARHPSRCSARQDPSLPISHANRRSCSTPLESAPFVRSKI